MQTIEHRKISFIKKYIQLNDIQIIEKLEQIINESETAEQLKITERLKEGIDSAILSLDSGNEKKHSKVINILKNKYPELHF